MDQIFILPRQRTACHCPFDLSFLDDPDFCVSDDEESDAEDFKLAICSSVGRGSHAIRSRRPDNISAVPEGPTDFGNDFDDADDEISNHFQKSLSTMTTNQSISSPIPISSFTDRPLSLNNVTRPIASRSQKQPVHLLPPSDPMLTENPVPTVSIGRGLGRGVETSDWISGQRLSNAFGTFVAVPRGLGRAKLIQKFENRMLN